ncbi:MAG: glycosyltransferase [bacterium]
MADPQLSIVLACYNESAHLQESFNRLKGILSYANFVYEIIFVDDRSIDNTVDIIENIIRDNPEISFKKIIHDKNMGRGKSVTDGFMVADGDVVGYIDVDLEIDAVYIYSFYHAIKQGYDAAIGERVSRFSLYSIPRFFTGRGYNMLMRLFMDLPLHDTESGIKFFNRQRLMSIISYVKDHHWFWDTEICARMYKAGYRIREIPCIYIRNRIKRSTVRLIPDSIYYLKKLLKFRKEYKA